MLRTIHGPMEPITSLAAEHVVLRSGAQCYYVADNPVITNNHELIARRWSGPHPSLAIAQFHAHAPRIMYPSPDMATSIGKYLAGRLPV